MICWKASLRPCHETLEVMHVVLERFNNDGQMPRYPGTSSVGVSDIFRRHEYFSERSTPIEASQLPLHQAINTVY